MFARMTRVLSFSLVALCRLPSEGTISSPPPLPDPALYAQIARIPDASLDAEQMAAARADGYAITMVYDRCAQLALEDARACPWLMFDEGAAAGETVDGALQAIILGLRQGDLPTHTELFARGGASAALADMPLFERPLPTDYAELIVASEGDSVLRRAFHGGAMEMYVRMVAGEPTSGLDAALKYLFDDYVANENDLPLIRIAETGSQAVTRFHALHEAGRLATEPQRLRARCAHPAAREYQALLMLLSFTDDPALATVRGESWPGLTVNCRGRADFYGNDTRRCGLRPLNRVALAVGNNSAYRAAMAGVADIESAPAS